MNTIGLIDDNDLFRLSLKSFISSNSNYSVILDSDSADTFFQSIEKKELIPDIVITDFQMPNKNGKTVVEAIKNQYPAMKTAVMSVFKHEHLIAELFQSGTDGFFIKSAKPSDLFNGIELILNGYKILIGDDDRLRIISSPLKRNLYSFTRVSISSRQFEFLRLCINTELTYKQIADQLNISPKTADRHRDDLFKKLNVKSRSGLLMYAIETGLYPVY